MVEVDWEIKLDINVTWVSIVECVKIVARKTLGESKGRTPPG